MRIAFVAAECTPLIKVGGLADVVGALSKALVAQGHDVRIFLPDYEALTTTQATPTPWAATAEFSGQSGTVHVRETVLPQSSVPLYLVGWPNEFRGTVYPLGQDPETLRGVIQRFVRFSLAIEALLRASPWKPDIVHCHDWHTALLPALLDQPNDPASILTIHNLDIQGVWSGDEAAAWLPPRLADRWTLRDQRGDLNLLQLGITHAHQVTTVSPTYAAEIVSPEHGERLDQELSAGGVVGILNGIDNESYNPETDLALAQTYNANTFVTGKPENKLAVQRALGLPEAAQAPLFVTVGRLVGQKGINLILPLIERLQARGAQVAFLGTGFPEIEAALRQAEKWPGVRSRLTFDSALGRRLYAAGDFFLMPSLFEPCGLGQLIALRYGAIPIVRDTGGLHDTVVDVDAFPAHGNGLVFTKPDPEALWATIERALALYPDTRRLRQIIQYSMNIDHSWYTSSIEYVRLYERIRKNTADQA